MVCSFRGFFFIKTKNHFAVRQLNDDSFVSQFSLRWEWQQFHRTRDRRRQKEDDEKEDARRTRDHRAFLFSQPEHDSDGENDSENSDGGNDYQDDDDDDDDDYDDDGEGFGTRRSGRKKNTNDDDDDDTEHQSSAALVDACRALSGLSSHPAHHSALRAANVVEELRAMLQTATGRAGDPVPSMAQMFAKECLQRLIGPNGTINTESASYDVDRFLMRSLSTEKPSMSEKPTLATKKLATTTSLNVHNKLPISSPAMMSESLLKTANSANIDRVDLGEHRVNTQTLLSLQHQKKRRRGGSRLFTRRRCIVLLCLFSVVLVTFSLVGRLTEAILSLKTIISVGNY